MPDTTSAAHAYYQRREQQERDLARTAMSPSIRNIHLKMAQHYAGLVGEALNPAPGAGPAPF